MHPQLGVDDAVQQPVAPAAPAFSLGALAATGPTRAKAKAKNSAKRAKLAEQEDDDSVVDVDTTGDSDEVWQAIQHDTLLMQVAKGLDAAPNCLLGLLPSRTFEDGQKVGKQLRGVFWSLVTPFSKTPTKPID